MKIIIRENQFKALHNSLHEQYAPLVTALRSLFGVDRNAYRYLARNLDSLLLGNPPKVRNRISPTGSASYALKDGQSILQAYMNGHLEIDEAAEVITTIFKSSTDPNIIKTLGRYFVDVDSDFVKKFKNGSLNFNELEQKYGQRQSLAIREAVLKESPLSFKYNSIFGSLDPNVAGRIVDKALIYAASKNVNVALKAVDNKGKVIALTNREDILTSIINGKLTDFFELKKLIINSIPSGPFKNSDTELKFVKDKIIMDLTADDLIEVFKGKSLQEIKSSISKDGIFNPDVSSAIFRKLNPLGGIGDAFWSGVKADSAGKIIYRILMNKLSISSVQTVANPVFKNVDQEDFKKLLFWSITGLGDYQKVRSILNTFGKGPATANVLGQYVWAYLTSAVTVLVLRILLAALGSIFTEKQIFPNSWIAWAEFVKQDLLNVKNFAAGPIGRILVELGFWMFEKSPGGKLPVEVYQIINRIKELLGIAEQEMEDAREMLPLNTDGTIIQTTETPTEETD